MKVNNNCKLKSLCRNPLTERYLPDPHMDFFYGSLENFHLLPKNFDSVVLRSKYINFKHNI